MSFHAFNDLSGCSFYNHNTGETISIEVGSDELLDYYHSLVTKNLVKVEIYDFLVGLIQSEYINIPSEFKS